MSISSALFISRKINNNNYSEVFGYFVLVPGFRLWKRKQKADCSDCEILLKRTELLAVINSLDKDINSHDAL